FLPVRFRRFERHYGIDRLWRWQMRLPPHEHKGHLKSLAGAEFGDSRRILSTKLDRRAKPNRVGTSHGHQICIDPTYPRHDVAVVEPQPQVHAHRYAAADPFDDADHVHGLTADRHEVDESYGSLIGVEFGLQHHGVAAVPAARRADWAGWRDQPPTVFFGAKQSSEETPGVEPRYTQPVDRPIAANQRRRLRVADNRVILNRQRQGDLLGSEPSHRPARWRRVFDPPRASNPWLRRSLHASRFPHLALSITHLIR